MTIETFVVSREDLRKAGQELFVQGVKRVAQNIREQVADAVRDGRLDHLLTAMMEKDVENKDVATTEGKVSVSMTPEDVIAEQVKAIELHDGDIVLFEVAENVPMAQLRAFRRSLHALGQEYGWKERGIAAMAFPKGTVEVTKLTTKRLDDLETKTKELDAMIERLCEC